MNKLTTVFALLSLLIFSTCSKDFLEVEPLVGSTEVNYYQNGNDAEAAIIACYNPLQQEVTNIQGSGQLAPHFRWYFGDVCSDDSEEMETNLSYFNLRTSTELLILRSF